MIKRTVVLAPAALTDLALLRDWIAEAASRTTAESYLERVETFLMGFDIASERGTQRNDIRPGLRIVGYQRRLTIAFVTGAKTVTILRVFHRGQDWERALTGN